MPTNTPGGSGEHLGDVEGLGQEALDLARPGHDELVLFRELLHAEDRDDVLQRLVGLQNPLHLAGDSVMLLAHHARLEDARRRIERIDSRVDAELRDLPRQHGGRVEMRERCRRRRIGEVVSRDVDRLDRGDRALVGRGDPLLQRAHVGGEGRLIADRGRDASQQRRDLGSPPG